MKDSQKPKALSHPPIQVGIPDFEGYPDDELIAGMRDTSKNITNLFNSLIGFGLFGILALSTPDVSLLGANASLRVPIAGFISFKTFVVLGPVILLVIRLTLHVYVQHWIRLDKVRSDRNLLAPAEIAPLQHHTLRLVTTPLLYLFVPCLLVFFAWKGAAIPFWSSILWSTAFVGLAGHVYLYFFRALSKKAVVNSIAIVLIIASSAFATSTYFVPDAYSRSLQLTRADLSKQSFIKQDFRGADLRYSNMSDSELGSADLTGADLTGAILRGTDLRIADLRRAILYNANLEGADLRGARLEGADFNSATLSNANPGRARLINADLMQADLRGADLQRANLKDANLFLADLSQADLRNVVNLSCDQLALAAHWHSAYRSDELACGAAIPSRDSKQENRPAGTTNDEPEITEIE